jgi:large subunit ribosomal protein L4
MKLAVRTFANQVVREVEVPDVIAEYPYKAHLIHQAVVSYLASLRSGTHKAKVRSEVSGAGKKLWKQKGTGRARMGSIRSPLWRKGGIVHGPVPRDYTDKLSVREKRNALKSAFARKVQLEGVFVVDSMTLGSHRTAEFAKALAGIGVQGKALIVDRFDNRNLLLAARNNPNLKTVDALAVNVYDVVDRTVVLSEDAFTRFVEMLSR